MGFDPVTIGVHNEGGVVVGPVPHQFILRMGLRQATRRIRTTREPIATVAFDAGFTDLSTLNRTFKAAIGASPTAVQTHGGIAGRTLQDSNL